MKKNFLIDLVIALVLGTAVFLFAYIHIGYAKHGLEAPLVYSEDGISALVGAKEIGETGWLWENERLGAPNGVENYDFVANFLCNADALITKIMYAVTHDDVKATNLQWLSYFFLTAVFGYAVLRALKVRRFLACIGAWLFSSSSYMFARNVNHMTLSAFYFVPLSVLLCVWLYEDRENYLQFNRRFFKNPRNVLTIVFCFLIANNGAGYYQFYTCFLLSVTELLFIINHHTWKKFYKFFIQVVLIVFFAFLAILPALLHQMNYGNNLGITYRGIAGVETYGLKITQFFVPLFAKRFYVINKVMDIYNSTTPLTNENMSSFLGIWGGLGFLLSLLYLISYHPQREREEKQYVEHMRLYAVMIVGAILFATIGGFASLLALVTNFTSLRGNNRISIFILFISILVFCHVIQRIFDRSAKTGFFRKLLLVTITLLIALASFYIQIPGSKYYDGLLEGNLYLYQSDERFIDEVEKQLQPGDCVYQLPYHEYPEGGMVNEMSDYQLFVGYIHSDDLKWSYGSLKGREEDEWNKTVSELPPQEMIDELIDKGFTGIYIDTRAYEENALNELKAGIEQVLQEEPLYSEGNTLMFYNLYPYMEAAELEEEKAA